MTREAFCHQGLPQQSREPLPEAEIPESCKKVLWLQTGTAKTPRASLSSADSAVVSSWKESHFQKPEAKEAGSAFSLPSLHLFPNHLEHSLLGGRGPRSHRHDKWQPGGGDLTGAGVSGQQSLIWPLHTAPLRAGQGL